MPMKVTAGLTKKIGQPGYGSLGASCSVEVEWEQSLLLDDPPALQNRLVKLYAVCRTAVEDELHQTAVPEQPPQAGQLLLTGDPLLASNPAGCRCTHASTNNHSSSTHASANHTSTNQGSTNQDCVPSHSSAHLATERQLSFAMNLARQIRALGGQRLNELSRQTYGRSIEELSSSEASQLIDLLKALRAGSKSVDELLPEAVL